MVVFFAFFFVDVLGLSVVVFLVVVFFAAAAFDTVTFLAESSAFVVDFVFAVLLLYRMAMHSVKFRFSPLAFFL